MTKTLYEKALALKDVLDNHEDVVLLATLETAMSNDPQCRDLLFEFTTLQNAINKLLLTYDVEAIEVREKRVSLAKIKYELDKMASVQAYNGQYKKVAKMYNYVSHALFDDYCSSKGCSCQ